ncbi:hypothetical protein KI809_01050 [Geobacter pelophilus]|uniref:Uncharacterized protein n=1 Tax=Geoanaerobacter pelophilus TaxID=60036 RepID=A0AAW4L497_9BACT|nr:DUF6178 family protein [Geoanaerobacter pelophilus]MBT0662874.1 hypothetical protein [Geoanaerobacter pelophilus]
MNQLMPNLRLIRGGKLSTADYLSLTVDDKLTHLRALPVTRRLELLIEDSEAKKVISEFTPQEFYLMVKEIGETDASQLLDNGTTEQISVCLDLDLWQKWEFSHDKAIIWLEYLLSVNEADSMKILSRLDPELLQLILFEEIEVGGGGGELATDSERLGDWDHSFDSVYYLTFRNAKHARLIGTLIDIIFRNDRALYLDLMEGRSASVKSEIEDMCYQFRCGRLADLGFPSYEEAMEACAPLPPERYAPGEEKISVIYDTENAISFVPPLVDETLLSRVLAREMTESLRQELELLLNCAMVAEGSYGADLEKARSVTLRVYGWLNLALEYLCGSDESAAAAVVRKEQFKRLFRLGHGIVQQVARLARTVTSAEYATGKALRGFTAERPLFYRGLDDDRADGYREFNSMNDIRLANEFLNRLRG